VIGTVAMAGSVAARFFGETKHPSRIHHAGVMDWSNRPDPIKRYRGLESVPLPRPGPVVTSALDAVATISAKPSGPRPTIEDLARLLVLGAGVARTLTDGSETYHFRTYASAGALYPVEVYVACGDLPGLGSGVYHFGPRERGLVRLHGDDRRRFVVRAAGGEPAVGAAPVVLILTGIPWRTAWKYTERGYRHLFWDAGMIVANLLSLSAAAGLEARVILGFADREIEELLGLDGRTEFPLALVAIGSGDDIEPSAESPNAAAFVTEPLSRKVIEYPMITEVNDAGRLESPDDVAAWRARGGSIPQTPSESSVPPPAGHLSDDLATVIRRRGSARILARRAIPAETLRDILWRATRGIPTDYRPNGARSIEPFLIVNQVDGHEPGAYRYRGGELILLRRGNFRRESGTLALGQRLAADASATHFLMANLAEVMEALGDRGYRAAELEAGIVAGKLYLGAYAHRLGATGLTFFDDPVTEFFGPPAAGLSCLLVVAVGVSPRLERGDG
jgi:SagB-type dehydrogenase family enzyme